MRALRVLWHDERGLIEAASQILLTVILALGAIVGLVTFRDQVVQEMGDVAVALESLDQSYSGPGVSFVDSPTTLTDPVDAAPACLDLSAPATPEG
jgi:hypothetical protein